MALCQFDITIFNFMAETSFEFFLKKLFVRYEVGKMWKEPPIDFLLTVSLSKFLQTARAGMDTKALSQELKLGLAMWVLGTTLLRPAPVLPRVCISWTLESGATVRN